METSFYYIIRALTNLICTRLWKGLLVGNKLNDYSKNLGNPQDNLKSAFTLPLAGKDLASHVWKKVSPMNVGRATHACLATKFGVSQKEYAKYRRSLNSKASNSAVSNQH